MKRYGQAKTSVSSDTAEVGGTFQVVSYDWGRGKEYGIRTFVVLSSAVTFGRVSVISPISLVVCLARLREETTQAFVVGKNVERPGTFCSCSLVLLAILSRGDRAWLRNSLFTATLIASSA